MGVRTLRRSLLFSILLHAGVGLVWLFLSSDLAIQTPPARSIVVELEPPRLTPEQARKKKTDDPNSRRIVQTDRGQITKEAAPDAFLGEKTQTVDRQTVSKKHLTVTGSAKAPANQPKKMSSAGGEDKNSDQRLATGPLSKFGVAMVPSTKLGGGNLVTENERNWSADSSNPEDYVPGIKESDRTLLNTKQYAFYGYFQRIRQRLELAWGPILRDHLTRFYRNGRQLASDMEHTTKVLVIMNKGGEITEVKVVSESGTATLDDAAVKAFNQAGPFPNPPKGIVDRDGKVLIRWDFVLKS